MHIKVIKAIFICIVKLGNFLGSSPYRWDKYQNKLYIVFWSHFRQVHFWSWIVAYVFVVLPTHLYQLYTNGKYKKFSYTLIIFSYGIVCLLMIGVLAFNTQSVCRFKNGFWKYLPEFHGKYSNQSASSKTIFDYFVELVSVLLCAGCLGCAFVAGIDCFLRPQEPTYLLFSTQQHLMSWPLILVASGWFTNYAFGCACVFDLIIYHGLLYIVYYMPFIRYEMRCGLPSYKTHSCLRSNPNNLVVTWKSIELLLKIMNVDVAFIHIFIQYALEAAAIISIVTLTFQWSACGFFSRAVMGVCMFVGIAVWPFFLTLAGIHYKCTQDTIRSWKRQHWQRHSDQKYIEKVKRSCSPFSFGNGGRIFITPMSVPHYWHSFGNNCFSAIITYEHIIL